MWQLQHRQSWPGCRWGKVRKKSENLTSAEFWKWIASGEERQTKRPNQELSTVQLHALASYWLPSFTPLELVRNVCCAKIVVSGLATFDICSNGMTKLHCSFSSFLYLNCFWFFKCFNVPCGKFGSPYLGKTQQPQEQHYPFLQVSAEFSCVHANTAMAASVWDLHRCWCMRLHTGAARTLEVQNPLPHWGLELASVLRLAFQSTLYQLSYPRPVYA